MCVGWCFFHASAKDFKRNNLTKIKKKSFHFIYTIKKMVQA